MHSPLKGGIEEMPLGISSMGVNIQIPYPHRLKMDLIFLILNITSAIFSRLPQGGVIAP